MTWAHRPHGVSTRGKILDCAALRRLTKLPGRHRRRGTYAEENAFAICPAMRWLQWLHMIPDQGYVSGLATPCLVHAPDEASTLPVREGHAC